MMMCSPSRGAIIVNASSGLSRVRSQGKRIDDAMLSEAKQQRVRDLLAAGTGLVKTAHIVGCGISAVQRIKATLNDAAHAAIAAELRELGGSDSRRQPRKAAELVDGSQNNRPPSKPLTSRRFGWFGRLDGCLLPNSKNEPKFARAFPLPTYEPSRGKRGVSSCARILP